MSTYDAAKGRYQAIRAVHRLSGPVEYDEYEPGFPICVVERRHSPFHLVRVSLYEDLDAALQAIGGPVERGMKVVAVVDLNTGVSYRTATVLEPTEPTGSRLNHEFLVDVEVDNLRAVGARISDVEHNKDNVWDYDTEQTASSADHWDSDLEATRYLQAVLELPAVIEQIYANNTDGDGWDIDIMSDLATHMKRHRLWEHDDNGPPREE